uniref:Uncharacterized protein n=1 Tax=Haptolina brevifila TaxID=156173 RepID=A0A7S2HII4_9EUKA
MSQRAGERDGESKAERSGICGNVWHMLMGRWWLADGVRGSVRSEERALQPLGVGPCDEWRCFVRRGSGCVCGMLETSHEQMSYRGSCVGRDGSLARQADAMQYAGGAPTREALRVARVRPFGAVAHGAVPDCEHFS